MKSAMAVVFGFSVGFVVSMISPYNGLDWQFWAAVIPILIAGAIYANVPKK